MSEQAKKPVDNRTAATRLLDAEKEIAQLGNASNMHSHDINLLKQTVRLLANKVEAMVQATISGETISDGVLERIMVENNVADLTNRVTNMVVNGVVVEEAQISENSFIVGKDVDEAGKVVNPRLQFALKALPPETQAKLLGKKAGDRVKFRDDAIYSFEVMESYAIQPDPEQAPAPEPTAPTGDPSAPEADASAPAAAPASEPDASAPAAS